MTSKPPKNPALRKRLRLIGDLILIVGTIVSTVVAVWSFSERDEAEAALEASQQQEQSITIENNNLNQLVDENESEVAAMEETIAELQSQLEGADTATDTAAGEVQLGYLTLDQNLDNEGCSRSRWDEDDVQYAGAPYSRGFNCYFEAGTAGDLDTGFIDFLVPTEATSLTGIAGNDQLSEAGDMSVRFAIYDGDDVTNPLWTTDLGSNGSETFSVDVTDVSRIRFELLALTDAELNWYHSGFADTAFAA